MDDEYGQKRIKDIQTRHRERQTDTRAFRLTEIVKKQGWMNGVKRY